MGNISCLLWSITLIGVIYSVFLPSNNFVASHELWSSVADPGVHVSLTTRESPVLGNAAPCGKYVLSENQSMTVKSELSLTQTCLWQFSTTSKCKIHAYFSKFDLYQTNCRYEYVLFSDGRRSKKFCKSQTPEETLISATKTMKLTYFAKSTLKNAKGTFEATVACLTYKLEPDISMDHDTMDLNASENCTCGQRRISSKAKIVGGQEAQRNEFPWMVALYREKFGELSTLPYCGGTLITSNIVLTAAHCIEKSRMIVGLGIHNTLLDLKTSLKFEVKGSITHEKYNAKSLNYDIALLILEHGVTLSHSGAETICLPTQEDLKENLVDKSAVVIGWGSTLKKSQSQHHHRKRRASIGSQVLLKANVKIVSDAACKKYYKQFLISPSMLCAWDEGTDACDGDSGGPLMIPCGSGTDHLCLAGLVSWGSGCGRPNAPGVYTNCYRQEIYSWILRNMKKLDYGSVCSR